MRDKIGQRGALALSEAMSLNRTITYVDLRQQAFEYYHKRMALFLEGIARNKQSAVSEICIEAEDPAGHVVSALSKVLLWNRGQLLHLDLTEMHVDDKAGIALADGLRRQKNLATLDIIKSKSNLAGMLRNNRTLKGFTLAGADEDEFDEKQCAEIKSMMLEALKENHTLKAARGYLELDKDVEIQRLLDLNKKGFFTAAALKGVPLPDSYVSNLADATIPNALARIGSEAGVGGIFSFLQQIHAVNTMSAHQKFGPAKKRPRKQATIGAYFQKKK